MKKLEPSYTAAKNENIAAALENSSAIPQQVSPYCITHQLHSSVYAQKN